LLAAGCDVGSLTAKAVILENGKIVSTSMMRVKSTAEKSSIAVLEKACQCLGIEIKQLDKICNTGYGRFENPFSDMNMSEISCHGMGAHFIDNSIRTIIDVGGQDCKAISIDSNGLVLNFIMNEKCAAGTGRCIELLANTIGVDYTTIGKYSLKSKKNYEITNKCSIFMELELLNLLYNGINANHLARAINLSVARRIVQLTNAVGIKENICITGGVAKNEGLVKILEELLKIKFIKLNYDPQLIGALGAAVFAQQELLKFGKEKDKVSGDDVVA